MSDSSAISSIPSSTLLSTPTSSGIPQTTALPILRHRSDIASFVIGFAIILAASLLNAVGLNLTKLDHVRTSVVPKASRKKDWMRPKWLLGMFLYIISQLIGSTLALEYMRAEYVAPLGSSSLIFNFLIASFLLGTPVTRTDAYGTLVIVLGVIGIVAFGSVNSGLTTGMSITRLSSLWARGGWIFFFIIGASSIFALYLALVQLDAILVSRSDMLDDPTVPPLPPMATRWQRTKHAWQSMNKVIRDRLTERTNNRNDKQLAWFLGVGWSVCGGLLAGGCLVFSKAAVKLISGSLSHENTGNQFIHPAAIITFLLLGLTAVSQIVCLNRGLKVYDSTLVVPVFYGIYTASGFIDSLIFNDEVDAYQSWTLFLVGIFILVLIGGVSILTNKKPPAQPNTRGPMVRTVHTLPLHTRSLNPAVVGTANSDKLDSAQEGVSGEDPSLLWQVGEESDDDAGEMEDIKLTPRTAIGSGAHEQSRLIVDDDEEMEESAFGPPRTRR